jgi:mono/diheme cytochrome c family protein
MSSQANLPPDADAAAAPPPGQVYGVLAEYDGVIPLLAAAQKVRDAGYKHWDTYTPIPIHGLDEAMGIRRTLLPWVVFGAGVTGALLAFLMQWWMNGIDYAYVVSGKPLLSMPAFIPIIFEVTILFSAITTLVGMLMFNKLPALYHSFFSSRAFASRVTTDRFFIGIEARDPVFDLAGTRQLLASAGSMNVETIVEAGPAALPDAVRRYGVPAMVVVGVLLLVPPMLIAWSKVPPNTSTRVQLVPDMDQQPKFLSQTFNPLFQDNRSMRPLVAGTVAVGRADLDPFLYRGIREGQWAADFPVPVTRGLLERGQARFEIFCVACHGWDGAGDGPVAVQGTARSPESWVVPTNLADATVRERANGHIFNTITNGIRTMPSYESQIPVADRWAIVSYVRALQLSQAAPMDLVPAERRGELR